MKRDFVFICDWVDNHGNIEEGHIRNKLDLTGKMKVITEGK